MDAEVQGRHCLDGVAEFGVPGAKLTIPDVEEIEAVPPPGQLLGHL